MRATVGLLDDGSSFADLGIEQIVKRAGLSRPTFYTYFKDKRDLILTLGQELEAELLAVAEPWFQGDARSAPETIAAILEIFRLHSGVARAVTEAATYDPVVAEFWRAFHEHFLPGSRRRIAAGNPGLSADELSARSIALIFMTERTLIEHVTRPVGPDVALVGQLAWLWEQAAAPG